MTVAHVEIVQTRGNGDVMMDIALIKENIVMEYQIVRMAVTRNQVTTTFWFCIYYDWYYENCYNLRFLFQFLCECGGESLSLWL